MVRYTLIFGLLVCSVQALNNNYLSYSYYDTASLVFVTPTSYYHLPEETEGHSFKMHGLIIDTAFTSSYNSDQIASYLSPFDKKELVVKEDTSANNAFIDVGSQDILSYNFNLVTQEGDYESVITFAPSKKVWSSTLNLYATWSDNWWIFSSLPIMHMTTDMRLQEVVKNDGGGASADLTDFNIAGLYQYATMKEAFASSAMKYGKINGPRSKTGLSDCVLKIGKDYRDSQKKGYIRPFVGMVIPSSDKPTAEYMFEPILGNGKHAGFISGYELGKQFESHPHYTLSVDGMMQITYLLPNHQLRSFDPAGKPWGRYMAMFANDVDKVNERYSFGINECTQKVKVEPGMRFVSNVTFSLHRNQSIFRCGYQTTVHATERVAFPDVWNEPAIASIVQSEALVNPTRGINNLLDAFKDGGYRGIQKNELSVQTALHPFYIAHQGMVSFVTHKKRNNKEYRIECGATVSSGTSNAVPREWAIHLIVGCCV